MENLLEVVEINRKLTKSKLFHHAMSLYKYLFNNSNEEESCELIRKRLCKRNKKNYRFHVFVLLSNGKVIGYLQFSVLSFNNKTVLAYLQYMGIADNKFMKSKYSVNTNFRHKGLSKFLIDIVRYISNKDAILMKRQKCVGLIAETEFVGECNNAKDINYEKIRLKIYEKLGAKVILLNTEKGMDTICIQPKLHKNSKQIPFLMLYISFNKKELELNDVKQIAKCYLNNFIIEGFNKNDVKKTENAILEIFDKAKSIELIKPSKAPKLNNPIL